MMISAWRLRKKCDQKQEGHMADTRAGKKKIVVIGAGAAGLMAACAAADRGAAVTIVEKTEKAGKKIYITGKGRCNLTNACDMQEFWGHVVSNPKFLYSAVYGFDAQQMIQFMEENGCPVKTERGDRVFPVSDHASDVTKALLGHLRGRDVQIRYHCPVRHIRTAEDADGRYVTGVELISGEVIDADAVILACGAGKARMPAVEGIDQTPGVIKAVEYLSETTRHLPDLPPVNAQGKHVVILGGGDTGNDCLATAIRQKCASAVQIEMMPAPPLQRSEENPWPQWPKVLKTDYGQEEAVFVFHQDPRIWSKTLTALHTEEGVLKSVETAEIHFEEGRPVISEERETIQCDLLIIAAGFTGCETELPLSAGIELTARGTVASGTDSYASNIEGIFSCGDMHRGASLVVWAIREGLECAREVDEWLMGYTNLI
jgi:NADPH-dependent glutamate synthase beta subunit-like oxidoreductase